MQRKPYELFRKILFWSLLVMAGILALMALDYSENQRRIQHVERIG